MTAIRNRIEFVIGTAMAAASGDTGCEGDEWVEVIGRAVDAVMVIIDDLEAHANEMIHLQKAMAVRLDELEHQNEGVTVADFREKWDAVDLSHLPPMSEGDSFTVEWRGTVGDFEANSTTIIKQIAGEVNALHANRPDPDGSRRKEGDADQITANEVIEARSRPCSPRSGHLPPRLGRPGLHGGRLVTEFSIAGVPARRFRTQRRVEELVDGCITDNYADLHDIQWELSMAVFPGEGGTAQLGAILFVSIGVPLDETIRIQNFREFPFLSILTHQGNVRTILFEMVTELKAQYESYLRGNQ